MKKLGISEEKKVSGVGGLSFWNCCTVLYIDIVKSVTIRLTSEVRFLNCSWTEELSRINSSPARDNLIRLNSSEFKNLTSGVSQRPGVGGVHGMERFRENYNFDLVHPSILKI